MNLFLQQHTQALLSRYLQVFPDEPRAMAHLQQQLQGPADCFVRSNMDGHVTCSAAVLSPDLSQVLLIHHKFLDKWLPPGGHYEEPGDLWASAVREVEEETGVSGLTLHPWCVEHGVPLDIDTHAVPANPAKGEGEHWHHDVRFLAVANSLSELVPQAAEVLGARWAPLDELKYAQDRRLQTLARKLRTLL